MSSFGQLWLHANQIGTKSASMVPEELKTCNVLYTLGHSFENKSFLLHIRKRFRPSFLRHKKVSISFFLELLPTNKLAEGRHKGQRARTVLPSHLPAPNQHCVSFAPEPHKTLIVLRLCLSWVSGSGSSYEKIMQKTAEREKHQTA